MQIFISHSSVDAKAAANICELLERSGNKCFIAPRDIRSGREYAEELINGIDRSTAMILLMSENANHSPHVLREVERAVSKSIPILVYKLEDVSLTKSMEYFLMTHQWINAKSSENYIDILRFVDDLKTQDIPGDAAYMTEVHAADAAYMAEKHAADAAYMAEKHAADAAYMAENPAGDVASMTKAHAANTASMAKEHAGTHIGEHASQSDRASSESLVSRKSSKTMILSAAVLLFALLCAAGIFTAIHNVCNSIASTVAVGDTVTFGSYNGDPIEWRVLKLSENRKQAVLVSAQVLTMKAYDAAESGKYNWYDSVDYWSQDSEADTDMTLQTMVRGNNIWSSSNIRTWLNCADEIVTYTDQAPHATAMAEHKNGYQNEAGFLCGFTDEELAAIVETENITKSNPLYDADTVTTMDRIYLLSLDELQWFDDAKISKFALPTQAAVEQDESLWYLLDYNEFNIKECSWWLREPVEGTASKCYLVGNGYTEELLRQENVGLEGFGIRPALTVDLRKVNF